MAKPRNLALDFFVFAVIRTLVAAFQMVSLRTGHAAAIRLARFVYLVDRRHRRVSMENLAASFPNMSERDRQRLTLGVYEHFLKVAIEIFHLPRRFRRFNHKRFVGSVANSRQAYRIWLDDSRPRLVVSGHLGNWEISNHLLGAMGLRSFAIARAIDNPFLNRFLLQLRQGSGQTILSKNEDFDQIQKVLETRQVLAMLADQSAGPRGYFVDFLGRPASTHRALALFAVNYDAPIIVTSMCRAGEGLRYQARVEGVIDPRDYSDSPNAPFEITADYTKMLETAIRRNPDQYFWLHNRWKHQPTKSRKKAA